MTAAVLEPVHIRRALELAFRRIAEELHRTREPWVRGRDESVRAVLYGSSKLPTDGGLTKLMTPGMLQELQLMTLRQAIESGEYSGGVARAHDLLREIGAPADLESPHFRDLALEILKLDAMFLEAQKARASGDYSREVEFIGYYGKLFEREPDPTVVAARQSGPRLSEVWLEYAREKTTALPSAQWSPKTASFQEATLQSSSRSFRT
jgi:hypothetical protein